MEQQQQQQQQQPEPEEVTADVLLKRGKKSAASYLQEHEDPAQLLDELLDAILDPTKPIDMWDTLEWCNHLFAGGRTPADFANTVGRYNSATTCGLVWTANFVAYRCRTCGISPCMSLCAQCFRNGNHEGHDFNMFRSQAGGACDCGDTNVMKDSGFCSKHGRVREDETMDRNPPPDLLKIAKLMMPRVLLRLLQHLREAAGHSSAEQILIVNRADSFVDLLEKLAAMGDPMRQLMTHALTDQLSYQELTKGKDVNYMMAKQRMKNFESPVDTDVKAFLPKLVHETFLEEFVFWMVKYEFSQKLTCLLLSMLPEQEYKVQFTRTFVMHYPRASLMMTQSQDVETLSNRVVHVSVQLFSNEALSLQMVHEVQLLYVIVISLRAMMKKTLQQSTLQDPDKNLHYVINCGHGILKKHSYWPLVSDLNNMFSHRRVSFEFLGDSRLLDIWFNLLSMFQGMNVQHREKDRHIEYEPNTYYSAFTAELESSASPMYTLLSHLTDSETMHLSISVLKHCMIALDDFFDAINFRAYDKPMPDQVTFHLPLHRHFAVFLQNCVLNQSTGNVKEVLEQTGLYSMAFSKGVMAHPLQTIVSFYEVLSANMWVRNGLHMRGQAMTYIQSHFCTSMVDADIFLLQVCATQLNSNWFVSTVIDRFRIGPTVLLESSQSNEEGSVDEKMLAMLSSLLTFLSTLVSVRTMLCGQEDEYTREEMVSSLCMADRTHSQLADILSEKCGQNPNNLSNIDAHIEAIADYKAPNFELGGHMVQGTYTPKPIVWQTLFDPIHTLLRAVHRKDYQAALDRFAAHTGVKNCWPPYRIPPGVHERFDDPRKLLFCSSLYALIFVVLQKSVHARVEVDEQILSTAVYLLELAVEYHSKDTCPVCTAREGPLVSPDYCLEIPEVMNGAEFFKDWFPNGCPIIASLTTIKNAERVETKEDIAETSTSVANEATSNSTELDIVMDHSRSGSTLQEALTHTRSGPLHSMLQFLIEPGTNAQGAAPVPSTDENQYALLVRPTGEMMPSSSDQDRSLSAMETDEADDIFGFLEDVTMASLPAPAPVRYLISIDESIISLLLKLYSKQATKSSKPTSSNRQIYRTPQEEGQVSVASCRIGDGVHFIGLLLDRFCLSHSSVEVKVRQIRDALWPSEVQDGRRASADRTEALQREERRRKAKERQQKLMQEFANRQKNFMENYGDMLDDESSDTKEEEKKSCLQEYECVICSQTSPSTAERPVAMVVLLQATSVLGHARPHDENITNLPCSELEVLPTGTNRANFSRRCFDVLTKHFDSSSWYRSTNIGWEGGVHVQSCGHYLHVDCHKSYMLSQLSQQQQNSHRLQQTLAPDRGEYYCPLCRQLANSVLPIHPSMGEHQAVVQCNPRTHRNVAVEMAEFMAALPTPSTTILKDMSAFMEDLTNATYVQYRTLVYLRTTHPLGLFVCSVARTNLEVDILQHGGHLHTTGEQESIHISNATTPLKKSCFVPLFHVLALHLKVQMQEELGKEALTEAPLGRLWHALTGLPFEATTSLSTMSKKQVPFLIRDINSMLIELLLSLPLNLDKVYFTCVVRVLYSLAVTQAVCRATLRMSNEERQEVRTRMIDEEESTFKHLYGLILQQMEEAMMFLYDEEENGIHGQVFESYVEQSVLPYLRICALLQAHLYNEKLPPREDRELVGLSSFLGLTTPTESASARQSITAFSLVDWVTDSASLVSSWISDFIDFTRMERTVGRALLAEQPLAWRNPYLLKLPRDYSILFEFYHKRQCKVCQAVPTDPSVCLACGAMLCLREACCRRQETSNFEGVQHSIECGAGTAVLLAVNSTSIIVIRGKRACLWGSVYLDSFGEEDRDLKRGKPLYLSEERYALLQHQWLTHSFDHCAHKRWVWHKDNL